MGLFGQALAVIAPPVHAASAPVAPAPTFNLFGVPLASAPVAPAPAPTGGLFGNLQATLAAQEAAQDAAIQAAAARGNQTTIDVFGTKMQVNFNPTPQPGMVWLGPTSGYGYPPAPENSGGLIDTIGSAIGTVGKVVTAVAEEAAKSPALQIASIAVFGPAIVAAEAAGALISGHETTLTKGIADIAGDPLKALKAVPGVILTSPTNPLGDIDTIGNLIAVGTSAAAPQGSQLQDIANDVHGGITAANDYYSKHPLEAVATLAGEAAVGAGALPVAAALFKAFGQNTIEGVSEEIQMQNPSTAAASTPTQAAAGGSPVSLAPTGPKEWWTYWT
jgi:hypothetical protein